MMNRSRLVAIAFLLCAPLCGGLPGQDDPDAGPAMDPALAAAEARLIEARASRDEAFDALEALILELGDDYDTLTTGPDAPTHKHALVLAIADSLETASTRLASEASQGRTPQRGTRRRILQEAMQEPVSQAATIDERLAAWITEQVAEDLSRRSSFDDLTNDDILRIVDELFAGDLNWFEFWNERMRTGRPEVVRWRTAALDYEAAGLQLSRARYPERYGPRGEQAPVGMVVVPGGTYELGPNTGWDRSHRRVSLDAFAIDRNEVSCALYALFVNAQPLERRDEVLPRGWDLDENGRARFEAGLKDHPVVYLDLEQALAYATWAGKRLPTEDEWEAAAAGVEGRIYPWGNEFRQGRANGDGAHDGTLPVESFPDSRSAAGCFDMAGNAWEWTSTTEDGSDFDELPDELISVAIRGGSYRERREELTTRHRWTAPAHDTFGSPRYLVPIGFRCVKDLR